MAPVETGTLSAGLAATWTTLRVVHEARCPDIGPICAVRDEPPHLHDLQLHLAELRASFDYGLAEHWGVEVQLPLRVVASAIQYRRLDGTPFAPVFSDTHHRNETLVGLADPWLRARTSWTLGAFRLAARLGLTLPIGSTEPNPFRLGELGLRHQHIQLGTGTVNPVATVEASWSSGPWSLLGYGQVLTPFYDGVHGYRAGPRFAGGLGGEVVMFELLRATAALDVLHEEAERWDGLVLQDGNLGRTDLLVGGGVGADLAGVSFAATVRVPAFQHAVQGAEGGTLSFPVILGVSVSMPLTPTKSSSR